MILPELSWQFLYARLGWAVVLAALVVAAWPSAWRLPRRLLAGAAGASLLLMALPGDASAAWHLGLAFQYPSGLLTGLCLASLAGRWTRAGAGVPARSTVPAPLLPAPAAAVLAAAGLVLYLDDFGLLSLGWYYAGFGPTGAPLAAVLLAGASAAAIARGRGKPQAAALLGAVALFSLARLPSGNLWDALLDPLLWAWSLAVLAAAGARRLRRMLGGRRQDEPAAAAPELELPALQATGGEPFSPIKE